MAEEEKKRQIAFSAMGGDIKKRKWTGAPRVEVHFIGNSGFIHRGGDSSLAPEVQIHCCRV